MRLLHIASGDLWAGAETQIFYLCRELNRRPGVNLSVILLNPGELANRLRLEGVNVLVIDESKYSFLYILREIIRYSRSFNPQIIHSHRIKENLLGALVSIRMGCISLRTVHGDYEVTTHALRVRTRILIGLDRLIGRFLQDGIVTVSNDLRRKIQRSLKSSNIKVIENSLDINYLTTQSEKPTVLPDYSKSNLNLGFIGRLVEVKRVHLIVSLIEQIIKRHKLSSIRLYIVGSGPLEHKIRDLIEQKGLSQYCIMLGFVENTAPLIKQLDYLLLTSEHEGLPMTVLEAMALKTCVISHKLPSVEQLLLNNRGGYFFDAEQIEAASDFVVNQVINDTYRHQKTEFAHQRFLGHYEVTNNADKYLALYQSFLTKNISSD